MDNRGSRVDAMKVAIIGAGIAGAACARALCDAGAAVMVFEKSRGPGGRMATRRASYADAQSVEQQAEFDHGAPYFEVASPELREAIAQAERAGCVASWHPRVRGQWPNLTSPVVFVPVPGMPALARHILAETVVQTGRQVQKLLKGTAGWQLLLADGNLSATFDHVVLCIPPAQAAVLLAEHHPEWSNKLASLAMAPCWTLMVVTDHIETDWDVIIGDGHSGVLSSIVRNDHKPARHAPSTSATWVAHASALWSASHLEDYPQAVTEVLVAAFEREVSPRAQLRYHYRAAHRWRYAQRPMDVKADATSWSDFKLGLSVCGDFLGNAGVESAWQSGTRAAAELAGVTTSDRSI